MRHADGMDLTEAIAGAMADLVGLANLLWSPA